MKISRIINSLTCKTIAFLLFLSAVICFAGCSRIITVNDPPQDITEYSYNEELGYLSKSDDDHLHYFAHESGAISEKNTHIFDMDILHNELTYKIKFAYTKLYGNIVASDLQGNENNSYFLKVDKEQNKGVFICLNTPKNNYYPYLYNIRTNTVDDIFEGTGLDQYPIDDFIMNSDYRKALIYTNEGSKVLLCDTKEKSLSDMTILSGVENISKAIWTTDNNILLINTDGSEMNIWYYNTKNGKCKTVSDDLTPYNSSTGLGTVVFDTEYAIKISENGAAYAINLTNNTSKKIKGITFASNSFINSKTYIDGQMLVTLTSNNTDDKTASMINLKDGKIIKERSVSSEFTAVAYYDVNNIIAYNETGSRSLYFMGEIN